MPITLLDGILVVFILISAMLSMVRGFSREVLSIASWAAAAVAAFLFYKPIIPYVQPYINNEKIAMAAAVGIVFFVDLIVITIITMKIADFIIDSRIGALDRTLGFLYGAARGILVVAVSLLFFNWLVGDKSPALVSEAKSRLLLESIGATLKNMLPEDLENFILKKLNLKVDEPDAATKPTGSTEPVDSEADASTEQLATPSVLAPVPNNN